MGARFVFRLESILNLRRMRERQQRRVMAGCWRAVRAAERTIQRLEAERAELTSRSRENRDDRGLDPQWQLASIRYGQRLGRTLQTQLRELARRRAELEEQRQELTRRMIDVKTIEKLKDRQFAKFMRELNRKEQRENDETAARNFVLTASGSSSGARRV